MSGLPSESVIAGHFPPDQQPAWEVALLFPPQGGWSLKEYFELSESTNRLVEYTRGHIEVLEMPTIEHQRIIMHLLMLLRETGFDGEHGMALMAPLQTTILPGVVREPDIVFKLRENIPSGDVEYFHGADLVMEVVSADKQSHERDYVKKRAVYAEAGIPEYWIVDPQQQRVVVLTLEGGQYVEHANLVREGVAASRLLAGFEADVAAIFAAGKVR